MLKWADVGKLWGSVAGHTHIYPMWAARGCTHTELTAVFYGKAHSWLGHRKPMQDPEQFCSSGPPVLLSCLFPDLFFSLSLSSVYVCLSMVRTHCGFLPLAEHTSSYQPPAPPDHLIRRPLHKLTCETHFIDC